ncbi:hypothetical protein RB195_022992 [Necator americanus]|uniref:Reverse transcriptase domain-containing protein n=1 Tax=Necator americanus TaxID=51031 RepID=A0ABR1EJL3_NECAM
MTICTYNACTLASDAASEELIMRSRKVKYDVIVLTETRGRICDSRGVAGVGPRQHEDGNEHRFFRTTYNPNRTFTDEKMRFNATLAIFAAYAPISSYEEEEVEAFCMDLEKFYREDHIFYKVIIGDFNAKIGPRSTPEKLRIYAGRGSRPVNGAVLNFTMPSSLKDLRDGLTVMLKFYAGPNHCLLRERLILPKRRKAERAKTTLLTGISSLPKPAFGKIPQWITLAKCTIGSLKTLELICQRKELRVRKALQTNIDRELFASLVGFWKDTVMDNVDDEYERLVEHLHDCTSKAKSFKTTKSPLSPKTLADTEATNEDLKERRAEVLAEAARQSIRYANRNFANRKTTMTALWTPDRTTTAFRRRRRTSCIRRVNGDKKGYLQDIDNYRPIWLLFVICKLFTRVMLNRIERTKTEREGQPCEQAGFRKGKAYHTVETEAVMEGLNNQGVPPPCIKILRELYSNFMSKFSPLYNDAIINVKRGVRQGIANFPQNIQCHYRERDARIGMK